MMKPIFAVLLALALPCSAQTQADVLPPNFELFGLTNPDYVANWFQYAYNLTPGDDFFLPASGPLDKTPIYYLQRVSVNVPPLGTDRLQNYYLPNDVYIYLPVITFESDNIGVPPPGLPVERLRDEVRGFIDAYVEVHAFIDGIEVPDMAMRRIVDPVVFGVNINNPDNILSELFGMPISGLQYPLVADGYFLMIKPLPVGPHHVETVLRRRLADGTIALGGRQYIVNSLPRAAFVSHQIGEIVSLVTRTELPPHRHQPLVASLQAAQASLAAGNVIAGKNQLQALLQKIRAQVVPDHPEQAQVLVGAIQLVMQQASGEAP